MKRYLVTIALAALFWPLASYAFDFKGIVVGQPATPEQVFEKLTVRCGAGSANRQICNGTVSFGRETGQMNLVINERGIVQRIHIMQLPPSAFDSIAPLLVEKFGPPKSTDERSYKTEWALNFNRRFSCGRRRMTIYTCSIRSIQAASMSQASGSAPKQTES